MNEELDKLDWLFQSDFYCLKRFLKKSNYSIIVMGLDHETLNDPQACYLEIINYWKNK